MTTIKICGSKLLLEITEKQNVKWKMIIKMCLSKVGIENNQYWSPPDYQTIG